jgi:hypothetical protein
VVGPGAAVALVGIATSIDGVEEGVVMDVDMDGVYADD